MTSYLIGLGVSPVVAIYALGIVANIAVELTVFVGEVGENTQKLPARYRNWKDLAARSLFAITGAGPLAVLIAGDYEWMAIYVGMTAPLILNRAAAGVNRIDKLKT
jgi:hypothetical protein